MTRADKAVARGIVWLNANIPDWQHRIDAGSLNLAYPCDCVLGQLSGDGDFYQHAWEKNLSKDATNELGFSAPRGLPYRSLTAAWRRALKRLGVSSIV